VIGILGGSFDPIHYGHLRTALDVQQALDLEQVRLIPLRDPSHRGALDVSPETRLAMVSAAVAGEACLRADDRELKRSGKSYTLDTLVSLREEIGAQPICLLMGTDAFRSFPDWHKPDEIFEQAHLVVMQRPGEARPEIYPERTVGTKEALKRQPAGCVLFLQVTQLEISATGIRTMLRLGRSPRYLLPDEVLSIIRQQQLYL